MTQLDGEKIKKFYEDIADVWPQNDLWHRYSKEQIEKYIRRLRFCDDPYILNAGSGGNTYGLNHRMHHVDIAENKINNFSEYSVASIEALPFDFNTFTDIICVGSVLNYCDALHAISELSRILKTTGRLVIEYESSWGFEHRNTQAYMCDAEIIEAQYCGQIQNQWVYSPKYIKKIINSFGLRIVDTCKFHYLSGVHYNKYHDENTAAKYTFFDKICRFLPYVHLHSNNIIFTCFKI